MHPFVYTRIQYHWSKDCNLILVREWKVIYSFLSGVYDDIDGEQEYNLIPNLCEELLTY